MYEVWGGGWGTIPLGGGVGIRDPDSYMARILCLFVVDPAETFSTSRKTVKKKQPESHVVYQDGLIKLFGTKLHGKLMTTSIFSTVNLNHFNDFRTHRSRDFSKDPPQETWDPHFPYASHTSRDSGGWGSHVLGGCLVEVPSKHFSPHIHH